MKKKMFRQAAAFLLACAVLLSGIAANAVPVSAASGNYKNIMHKTGTARANTPVRYKLPLSQKTELSFIIVLQSRTGTSFTVKDSVTEASVVSHYLSAGDTNWQHDLDSGIYKNTDTMELEAGDYILEVSFETEVNYDLSVNEVIPGAALDKSKVTLTKGFSTTLKVNGGKIKSCSSSDKKIAVVTNKGKVTGKKNGTAKIKVKLTNGQTLTCSVTVKSNQYSADKIGVIDTLYETRDMKAYNAAFDSKGNLVVKFMIVNNSSGKLTNISDLKVTVKGADKKTVASYKKSDYPVSINSYSDGSYTVKIPKSALKKDAKKIDLRRCNITITGEMKVGL